MSQPTAQTPQIQSVDDRPKGKAIGVLSQLMPFLAPYKFQLFLALLLLFASAAVALILPVAARKVIDSFSSGDFGLLDQSLLWIVLLAVVFAFASGLRMYFVVSLGEKVVNDIRKTVFGRVIVMSPEFYERLLTGEVLSRLTTDTTLVQTVIGSSVSWFARNMLLVVGGIIMMVYTSPKLTGLVFLIIPAVLIPILVLGRRLRGLSKEGQDWIARGSGMASELLLAVQTVQSFGQEKLVQGQYGEVNDKALEAAKKRLKYRAAIIIMVVLFVFCGVLGVLWVGARDVQNGAISAGALVQFIIYAAMTASATAALSELWTELQRAAGATERLADLIAATDTVSDPSVPKTFSPGAISFEDVTFRYPSRPLDNALDAMSFTVNPGETLAVVGPSGAGKSTLIQILQRFFDPQSGVVRIDGVNIADVMRADLRSAFAVVPQDPVIFATSALENIRFGRYDATDAEVYEAAKQAAAHGFIENLPDGYQTYVGERGVMLSGGQKQRIAIARAILKNAPILLLDEATSALDAESEQAVQSAFDDLSKDRTTLVVAHRLATVKKADRIIVLKDGGIDAIGTHNDLVAQKGLYARLATLQFTD